MAVVFIPHLGMVYFKASCIRGYALRKQTYAKKTMLHEHTVETYYTETLGYSPLMAMASVLHSFGLQCPGYRMRGDFL